MSVKDPVNAAPLGLEKSAEALKKIVEKEIETFAMMQTGRHASDCLWFRCKLSMAFINNRNTGTDGKGV